MIGARTFQFTALATLLGLVLACSPPNQALESAGFIDSYTAPIRPGSSVAEIIKAVPDAVFVPYLGYRSQLPAPVDGLSIAEFFVDDATITAPSERTKVNTIRLFSEGPASGRAVLQRATRSLGTPLAHGCSGIDAVGMDDTYVWDAADYYVVLTIPVSRQASFRSVSKLYFQDKGRSWNAHVHNFRSVPCVDTSAVHDLRTLLMPA